MTGSGRTPFTRSIIVALVATVLTLGVAKSVDAQIPAKFENLKVLPTDISRDSLLAVMRSFASGLGVRCGFCHVSEPVAGVAGGPGPHERLVFKLDDKETKKKARFMLRMLDTLNHGILPALPDRHDPPILVSCVTCHHGSPLPQTLDMVLANDITKFGTDSAVKRYAELREDVVSGRYDFSEGSVDKLARELAEQGKTADAITMLQMNQRYYPNSADIDDQLGDVYMQRGERDQAIVRYRTAVLKDPKDQYAQRKLKELGATPST